jgi:hypothetical protein
LLPQSFTDGFATLNLDKFYEKTAAFLPKKAGKQQLGNGSSGSLKMLLLPLK